MTRTPGSGISVGDNYYSILPAPDNGFSDIYFLQKNAAEHRAALKLRDAVLRLRYQGAFVAVPLFRVNTAPIGPHSVGEQRSFPTLAEP